jgi:hypothetical protein
MVSAVDDHKIQLYEALGVGEQIDRHDRLALEVLGR